ncbi:uncharacterized protein [Lolium perenne]|uniref:uncharacterized protein isoform X2 n=1 Tax=Lolium perenne TaxID=4522 RepID=UPI003A99859F
MRQRKILLPVYAPVGCESSLLSSRSCVHVGSPQLIPINLAVSSDLLDCEIFNLTILNAWQSGPNDLFEPTSVHCFVDSLSKKKIRIKALLLDEMPLFFYSAGLHTLTTIKCTTRLLQA